MVFDFLLSRILTWRCGAFLEQKLLADPNSSVRCLCDRFDSGTVKSFYVPNQKTSFFTGIVNQMKIKPNANNPPAID